MGFYLKGKEQPKVFKKKIVKNGLQKFQKMQNILKLFTL